MGSSSGRRRLFGIDRSGPAPPQTRRGAPLRPLTLPNLVGYVRLAGIPVFLALALGSDDGRYLPATLLFMAIAAGDYLDGLLARATGQYSRLGALLDPIVDRATVLAGVIVCWHFELLPRLALAALAARELATLVLAQAALRRGIEIEINWIGRIGVFCVFSGIALSLITGWWGITALFGVGVAIAFLATSVYVRAALGRMPE
ncbi:MAG TPA: CDP-alcohol phosphatidyltransferase family protein [Solirubrobacterales bacterium]|nr:CDP-alcohol phosphatidyltransferase family protein [Solirubrobacterales bacterium]